MEIKPEINKECCNEAVFWNPYNKVVQCHVCGQVFVKQIQIDRSDMDGEW